MTERGINMLDMNTIDDIEVVFAKHDDGHRLWVNVDGLCRLRAYKVRNLKLRTESLRDEDYRAIVEKD